MENFGNLSAKIFEIISAVLNLLETLFEIISNFLINALINQ